jgi:hypothetical protein
MRRAEDSELGSGAHHSEMSLVIGRSDANDAFVVLYQERPRRLPGVRDDRRRHALAITREDPDFHQRLIADVEKDRILGRWEASEDQGATWRKDFDLTFERA